MRLYWFLEALCAFSVAYRLHWSPLGNGSCVIPELSSTAAAFPFCGVPDTYCTLPRPRVYLPRKIRFNSTFEQDLADHLHQAGSYAITNVTLNDSGIVVDVLGPARPLWADPHRQLTCHDEFIVLLRGPTAQAAVVSQGSLSFNSLHCHYSASLPLFLSGTYFLGVYVGYMYGFNRLYPRAMEIPSSFYTDCWLHFHTNEELQSVWPMNRKTMADLLVHPGLIKLEIGGSVGMTMFNCSGKIDLWVHRRLVGNIKAHCKHSDFGQDLDPRYDYVFLATKAYRRLDYRQVLARHGISLALVGDSTMEDYLDHLSEVSEAGRRPRPCGHNLQTLFYVDPDSSVEDACDITEGDFRWKISYRRYYGSYQHHEGMVGLCRRISYPSSFIEEVIEDLRLSSPNVIYFGENFHTSSKVSPRIYADLVRHALLSLLGSFPEALILVKPTSPYHFLNRQGALPDRPMFMVSYSYHQVMMYNKALEQVVGDIRSSSPGGNRLKLVPLQWEALLPLPEVSRDGLHWHRSFYPCGVRPVDGKSIRVSEDSQLADHRCDEDQCIDFLEGYTNAASHSGDPPLGVRLRNLVPDAGVETMMQIMALAAVISIRFKGIVGLVARSMASPSDNAGASIPGMDQPEGGQPTVAAAFSAEQMTGLLGTAVEGLGGLEGVAADPGLEAAALAAFAHLNNPANGDPTTIPPEMMAEHMEGSVPKKRGRPKGAKKGTGKGRESKGVGAGKKACSECGTINPCRQMQCTECGHEMTPKGTTKRKRGISMVSAMGDLSVSPLAVVPPMGEAGAILAVKGKEAPPPGYRPCDACNSLQPSARKVCANCGAPIIPKSMTSRYWTALRRARPKLPEPFVHPVDIFPSWGAGPNELQNVDEEDLAKTATKSVYSEEPLEVVFECVTDPAAPDTAEVRPGQGVWIEGQGWVINAGRSQELMSLSPSYEARPMVVALASRTESSIELWALESKRVQRMRRLLMGEEVADFHWVEFTATASRIGILCVLFCTGYAALYAVPSSIIDSPIAESTVTTLKLRPYAQIRPIKKCLGVHAMRNRDKIWVLTGMESGCAAIFRVDEEEAPDGRPAKENILRKPLSVLSCSASGEVSQLLAVQWAPVEPESGEAPELFAVATQNGSVWVMSTSCPYPLATAASPAKFWVTDLCWSRMAPDHVFLACQLALAIDVTCPPSGSFDVRRCDISGTNRSLLQCKFMRPEVRQGYNSQACSALQSSCYAPWTFTGWTDGGIKTSDDLVRWTQYLIARYSYTAIDASKTLKSHMGAMTGERSFADVQHHRQAFFSGVAFAGMSCVPQSPMPYTAALLLPDGSVPYIPSSVKVPTSISPQGKVVLGVVSVGTCNSPYCGRGCWFANSARGCREGPNCKRCHNMSCALPADEERKANRKAKSRQRPSKKKRAKLTLAYARATAKGERPVKPPMNRQYLSAMKRLESLRKSGVANQYRSSEASPRDYAAVYRDLLSQCLSPTCQPPTAADSSLLGYSYSAPSLVGMGSGKQVDGGLSPSLGGYSSPVSSSEGDVCSSVEGSLYSSSGHYMDDTSSSSLFGSFSPLVSPKPSTTANDNCLLPVSLSAPAVNDTGASSMDEPWCPQYYSEDEIELELLLQESFSAACQQV
ncbi:hypothetical protein FOL47_002314 [Perkinsus chesapeaki]|uniref:Uncharacterized protein n=1 Tax=Perkinsus chesapeaki TaxID=330153 RepID=A0A7J6ME71_PERCH|nr:hypothetical protein FOL47_002314 [Perkinsus chesapeaki]